AAVTAFEFTDDAGRELGACTAKRVSEGHSATVWIHLCGIKPGFLNYRERLRGESLVQFDDVDVGKLEPRHLEGFRYCKYRAEAHFFGLVARGGEGYVTNQWIDAEFSGSICRHDDGGSSAIRHLRRVSSSDGAFGMERGLEC